MSCHIRQHPLVEVFPSPKVVHDSVSSILAFSELSMETPEVERRAANKHRFELELEFVQSLANPHYLQALAEQNILEDPAFVLYLDYLRYWSEPEYARFIMCVYEARLCLATVEHAIVLKFHLR